MGYATITLDFRILFKDGIDGQAWFRPGYLDGQVWIEPERRFDIAAIREAFHIPATWSIPFHFDGIPCVWIDPMYQALHILIESDSFPETPMGQRPPEITPMFASKVDDETGKRRWEFDYLDMSSVIVAQAAAPQAQAAE